MTDFNSAISEVVLNVLMLILTAAAAAVVAYIKKNLDAQRIDIGLIIATAVVGAVEQVGARQGWTAEQKLNAALGKARTAAEPYGLKLSDEQWKTFLEQAVAELKRAGGELVQPSGEASTQLKLPMFATPVLASSDG